MTAAGLLGIPPRAEHAWTALSAALERLSDDGRRPVCAQAPDLWSTDASAADRREAALACQWCPVLDFCAAYADAAKERYGVWAGVDRTARSKPRTTTPH